MNFFSDTNWTIRPVARTPPRHSRTRVTPVGEGLQPCSDGQPLQNQHSKTVHGGARGTLEMSEGNYLQEEQDDKKEAEVGNKPAYFRRRVEGVLVILRRSLRTVDCALRPFFVPWPITASGRGLLLCSGTLSIYDFRMSSAYAHLWPGEHWVRYRIIDPAATD
jgi:hypothetical protein